MNSQEASQGIEILKSHIPNREVLYSDRFPFPVWLTNKSAETICVKSVTARLQMDNEWAGDQNRRLFQSEEGFELPPGAKKVTRLSITPSLDCMEHSNFLDVIVEFGTPASFEACGWQRHERAHLDWVLVKKVPQLPGAQVFVSFKDPENEGLAYLAAKYLQRAGLQPYLARDDDRCGCDYWNDKIGPAIAGSTGVVVIWTKDVMRQPSAVLREITLAREAGTPLGLFLSRDAVAPEEYPASTLEHVRFDPIAPHAAFADAISAAAMRLKNGRTCF